MTKKFPGGFITKSPTAPSTSAAVGIWTLEQVAQYKQNSAWPSAPPPGPSAGGLWIWGKNNAGQLGQNDRVYRSSPVQVGVATTWSSIGGPINSILSIKTDGTLWAWGSNAYGQLGQNDKVARSSPVQVGALTNWSKVSAGNQNVVILKTDGTIWSWGNNYSGQNGQNTQGLSGPSSPVQIGSLSNWSYVGACSYTTSSAIKTDGTLWTWGNNFDGQLGQNDRVDKSSPVQVGSLTTWSKVLTGRCCAAIKTDGTLWTWGHNGYGALGQKDTVNRSSPVQVGALTNWSDIGVDGAGSNFMMSAIKTDGTLWTWGRGYDGALLQNDTNIHKSSPVQVGSLTTWSKTASVNNATHIIKTDGTLWAGGFNLTFGQLGNGTTANTSSPVQIGSLNTWQIKSKTSAGAIKT